MPITFAPIRIAKRGSGTDLTVQIRKTGSGNLSLELALSPVAQERVRYIDGDRVVAHYDEANQAWVLERINSERSRDGYKVTVRQLASGECNALIRLGCTADQAAAVLPAKERGYYEFLEISGNKATFVSS
jgi:hypothetical protein